jgi:iron(III) transport system ATP-binding protein
MIQLETVWKSYDDVAAVAGVTLRIERGELAAVLGPSGCGKTTLLRLIAGFEQPDDGTISIAGRTVAGPDTWTPPERRRVGMVFQDYALFPHLTVAENIGFGLSRRERPRRLPELVELVGLGGLERRFPHQLSGGQQQRVALARALAPAPELVLLDEPWSSIDPHLRTSLRDELAAILRRAGATAVLVTHDREEAFSLADRVVLMRRGSLVQHGTPEDLYRVPADLWSAEFVGAGNLLPARVENGSLATALGVFPATGTNGANTVVALVRPELVGLELDPDGACEVLDRQFRGHDVFYRLRLPDGTTVVSQRPSNEDVPLGARVTVRPLAGDVAVFDQ